MKKACLTCLITSILFITNFDITWAANEDENIAPILSLLLLKQNRTIEPIATLAPENPAVGTRFGESIIKHNNTMVVGAPDDGYGAVYIYILNKNEWTLQQKITGPASPGSNFGKNLALLDNELFVCAQKNSTKAEFDGAVHVYTRTGTTWTQQTTIYRPLPLIGSPIGNSYLAYFGTSIAVEGNTLMIGAVNSQTEFGGVYAFTKDQDNNWVHNQFIWPGYWPETTGANYWDYFGNSIALQDDLLIVGAPNTWNKEEGDAFIFRRINDVWVKEAELASGNVGTRLGDYFGYSVDIIDNSKIIVGAPGTQDFAIKNYIGAAYIYEKMNTSWLQTKKIILQKSVYTGYSLATSAGKYLISAPFDYYTDVTPKEKGGIALLGHEAVSAPDKKIDNHFGKALFADNDLVAVGSPLADANGLVYIYNPDCLNNSAIPSSIRLEANRSTITADDVNKVSFYATIFDQSGTPMKSDASFYQSETLLSSNFFTTSSAGEYTFTARYGHLTSNQVTINASDTENTNELNSYEAVEIAVDNNIAYVGTKAGGFILYDISTPSAPMFLGSYNTDRETKELIIMGNYVIMNDEERVHIVDVSTPTMPKIVSEYVSYREDYRTCDGWGISSCVMYPYYIEATADIIAENNYLYIVTGGDDFIKGDVLFVDITNISQPTLTQRMSLSTGKFGTQVSDLFVKDNLLFTAGYDVNIFDISNLENITKISSIDFGTGRYSFASFFLIDSPYLYINLGGGLWISDITNPSNPTGSQKCNDFFPCVTWWGGPGREYAVKGDYLYIAAGTSGVWNLNIPGAIDRSPYIEPPKYDNTGLDAQAIALQANLAFVAGGTNGLVILDIQDPTSIPVEVWNAANQ